MASNHKLTAVIKGRTLTEIQNQTDASALGFDDGSHMTVNTPHPISSDDIGKKIKAVRQKDLTLDLDFEDGTTLEITTTEATSSVMVRDKAHTMEYAD